MTPSGSYRFRPVQVVFGAGALDRLGEVVAGAGLRRVLLVTTPGRAAEAAAATRALGELCVGRFDRAAPHVPAALVTEAAGDAERLRSDGTVAIGGGSAIGLAKALALRAGLPVVAVPTTYSGSEMTDVWGITTSDRKETGRDERVAPRAVVYDARLTVSMPAALSAASGMNALAHCVEALYAGDRQPMSALFAREGIRVLAAALSEVVRDPADLGARERAFFGAHLAGRALDMTAMGLHHKLCHTLGGTFNLPHADTHTVVLPHALAYNAAAAPQAMARIARALNRADGGDPLSAARALHTLAGRLGAPTSLRALGMPADGLDRVADLAVQTPYPNPRALERQALRALLQRAFDGAPPRA